MSGSRTEPSAALVAAVGAGFIASSGVLVRLADVAPATAAVFRCLYALPLLALVARAETRRLGPRPRRARLLAAAAGLFLTADLVLWHHAIAAVGAGLATVLGNLQVVVVTLVAWLLLGERPAPRALAMLPVVLGGVVLISGVLGPGAYGERPVAGAVLGISTSFAYSGFLLLLRHASHGQPRTAGPLLDATAVTALAAAAVGPFAGGVDLVPSWPAHGWLLLLAVACQVLGWLAISSSLPRLPAATTALLLLLQPAATLGLAALVLAERPSPVQLLGVVVVLVGVVVAARAPAVVRRPAAGSPDVVLEPVAGERIGG